MKPTEKRLGMTRGFTLPELLVVLAVVCVLFLFFASPPPRHRGAAGIKCFNNLKNMGLANRIFATDHDDHFPSWFLTNQSGSREITAPAQWVVRHFQLISNELSTWKVLACPGDTRISPGQNQPLTSENISYFVAPDTDEERPEAVLYGDRLLLTNGVPVSIGVALLRREDRLGWAPKIHAGRGNIAMADGSVQQSTNSALSATVWRGTNGTLRLVVP